MIQRHRTAVPAPHGCCRLLDVMLKEVHVSIWKNLTIPRAAYKPSAGWTEAQSRVSCAIDSKVDDEGRGIKSGSICMSRVDDAGEIWRTHSNYLSKSIRESWRCRHFAYV